MGGNFYILMIILSQTTDKIRVVLENSVATNQMQCYASFRDSNNATFSPSRNAVATNNVTAVDLVAAPDSGYYRGIDYLSVFNKDTAANTVTVTLSLNGTEYELVSVVLLPGEKLEYTDAAGFVARTVTGRTKVDTATSTNPQNYALNTVVLSSDVTNSTNILADVTGLSFPVKAKTLYWFRFFIRYTTPTTTTGALYTINGPAFNYLMYDSNLSATSNTSLINANLVAYDSGTVSSNTGVANMGRAYVTGMVEPSADGTIIARFRSEVNLSTVTTVRGSFVRYRELYKYN